MLLSFTQNKCNDGRMMLQAPQIQHHSTAPSRRNVLNIYHYISIAIEGPELGVNGLRNGTAC
jgi:hypothetical protein